MTESTLSFKQELPISAKPVVATLAILGLAFVVLGELQPELLGQTESHAIALLLYLLSAVGWLLDSLVPRAARWFIVTGLIAAIVLVNGWLDISSLPTLVVFPTVLALALIGLSAAMITAVGTTVLLVLLPRFGATGADGETIVVSLALLWVTLATLWAVHRRVDLLSEWLWEYFGRQRDLLEESRDRRAELAQALDDLVHANRQMVLMNDRLAALRLVAEQAEKAKAAFVARVSHEFRTPLNIIIGMVNLLVESPQLYGGPFPQKALEHLQIVYRNCRHLSSMINDVLDLSQTEAGRMSLRRAQVDLAAVIDSAVAVVRPLMEEKGLTWQVATPPGLSQVYCDRVRIRQVILNLLSNAARFTEQGSITVQVSQRDGHLMVSVADTGPGILPEQAARIFEPFSQLAGELGHDKGGSGLGLSVSKQFVELHGGRMWLESQPGVGTTFFVELPISGPVEHVVRPGHQIREDWIWVERRSKPELPQSHYKSRMVICDETGDLCPALTHCSDEIEFIDTRSLPQASQELERCPAAALVVNAALPEGLWPLVDRAAQQMPHTPIIGCSYPPQMEHALRAGAIEHLIKPVTRAQVGAAIAAVGRPVRRVLVVDDDPDTRELLAFYLQAIDGGIQVAAANCGEQSLRVMRAEPPDLVFLDIVLPDIDGWQVLDAKTQDQALRDIPTVIISAQDPREGPATSKVLLASVSGGLSFSKLLACSASLVKLLLEP